MDNENYHHSTQSRSSVIVRKSDDNFEDDRRGGGRERGGEYSQQISGYRQMLPQGYMSNNRSNQSYFQSANSRRNEDRLTYPSFSIPPSFPDRHFYRPTNHQTNFNTSYYHQAARHPVAARQPVLYNQELPQSSDVPDIPPPSPRDVEESILDFESRLAQPSSHLKKFSNNSFGNNENIDDLTIANNRILKDPELGFNIDEIFNNIDLITNYNRNEVPGTELEESFDIPSSHTNNIDHNSMHMEQNSNSSPSETDIKSKKLSDDPLCLDQYQHSNGSVSPKENHKDKLQNDEMPPNETDLCEKRPVSDCHVCGDKAIAHMHYGGICCYSCKAFFRRAVQSGKDKEYRCKKDNDCEVTVKSRRHCQKCRFEKCGKVGMNGSWVLSDEQCEIRFGKTKALKRKSEDKLEELSKEERIPDRFQYTNEDAFTVEYIMRVYEASKEMISFSDDNTILWDEVFGKSSKHSYSNSQMDSLVSTVIKKNIHFLEANTYFKCLSFNDRKKLLSKNMTEMCNLRGSLRFNVTNKSFQWYFSSKDKQASSGLQTYSNAVIKEEDIKALYGGSNEAARTIVTIVDRIARLSFPTEVILLLMYVVVFNGDGLSLDRSEYVHEAQIIYLNMAYRFMFNKLPVIDIHKNMSKVMALLVDLRECGEKAASQKIGHT